MTIIEAINRVDESKPNVYDQATKIGWLSQLDGQIKKLMDGYRGNDTSFFFGYDAGTSLETELLAPAPYDQMYLRWLEAQMDLCNGEIDRFNVSISLYNTEYQAFADDYSRNHVSKRSGKRFLF